MPRFVRDSGPDDAPICVIGEAPGGVENARGRPFLGPAGQRLTFWIAQAGLNRLRDCYITNTYPFQPPHNKLELIARIERDKWVRKLHQRIAKLSNVRVLVPMGNFALEALTGLSQITKRRGSVYQYTDLNGRTLKVIPGIHPAATFRNANWEARCMRDWEFIASEMRSTKIRRRKRYHHIDPSFNEVKAFRDEVKKKVRRGEIGCLMFDIETPVDVKWKVIGHTKKGIPKRKKIKGDRFTASIAFAYSAEYSLTIPTTKSFWRSQQMLDAVWAIITELLDMDCDKGTQGDAFDVWFLRYERGIKTRRWVWDTKPMHHCLVPNESHDLGYMVSVDTYPREPYFKDEGAGQNNGIPIDLRQFWTYNGKDAACQWELWNKYRQALIDTGKMAFYRKHYRALMQPMLEMSLEGMATNETRRKERYAEIVGQLTRLRTRLLGWAGVELWGPKGSLSSQKLAKFLYDDLGAPAQTKWNKKKGERTVTTDEVAVRKVLTRFGPDSKKIRRACNTILDFRRVDTLKKFYSDKVADPDGRVRASYSFTPVTGRFSSGQNPMGRGWNAQNPDREARDFIVPDKGHIFLEVDLSQAESRIVYVLTRDKELLRLARTPPWEFDVHTLNASRIFHIDEAKVTKDQRYLGKRSVHAGHYGMMGETLAEQLLKDGYIYGKDDAQQLIDEYMQWRHPIPDVFQSGIRREVMEHRRLVNSWGREIHYQYERMGQELFRSAYAQIPQSEVPDLLNQCGLVPARKVFRPLGVRLRNQVHDSLLYSTPPAVAWELWQFLQQHLEVERMYRISERFTPRRLTIPVTVKLSLCWSTPAAEKAGDVIEFKKPPSKREFQEALDMLRERRREVRRAA